MLVIATRLTNASLSVVSIFLIEMHVSATSLDRSGQGRYLGNIYGKELKRLMCS